MSFRHQCLLGRTGLACGEVLDLEDEEKLSRCGFVGFGK